MEHTLGTVGIIGAGKIGRGIATLLTDAGISVSVGSRNPADQRFSEVPFLVTSIAEASRAGVVILSTPHGAIKDLLHTVTFRQGTVMIDAVNAIDLSSPGHLRSALPVPHGRWLQCILPDVQVARAFTHVQDELLISRAKRQPGAWAMAVAADTPTAEATASALVRAAGYTPILVGGLDASDVMDPGGVLFPNMFLPGDMAALIEAPPRR